ncbi:hypothetical protein SRHO_G00032320 [Serrasalmus rhombeus]
MRSRRSCYSQYSDLGSDSHLISLVRILHISFRHVKTKPKVTEESSGNLSPPESERRPPRSALWTQHVLGVITEDKTPYEDVYQYMNRTAAALFGGRVIKLTGLMLTDRKAKARLTQTPCSEDPRWNLLHSAMRDNPAVCL